MDARKVLLEAAFEQFIEHWSSKSPHQPSVRAETPVLLIELSTVVNTGDVGGALTAPREEM